MSNRNSQQELALTMPSLSWLITFFLLPSLLIFAYAFKPKGFYGGIVDGWTLDNIRALFNWNILLLIWRTLWLSSAATLLSILLAMPIGYHMATLSKGKRNLFLILVVIPFWSSLLIRIFAWKIVLHPEGILHRALEAIAIISPETMLLYNAPAVLFVMTYTFLPFAILPIYAAASKFNFSLIEAAIDLGASRLQAFIKIFIPGIQKGITTAFFMVFIPAVGSYIIPDLVGGTSSDMICNRIAQKTLAERNLPEASALAALLMLSLLAPMIALERYNNRKKKFAGARNRE